MLVWIQNEETGKWSKETKENQSIRDLYKGFTMRGDRYLALALVLKPKEGYRVEVYKVSEFQTEEVDSFFVSSLSIVTEKLNEWSRLKDGPLTPKISKIKAVLGGDNFVQNPIQKSEKGSYLIPVLSAKPKSVACKPVPCQAVPCVPCDTKKWEEEVKQLQERNNSLRSSLEKLAIYYNSLFETYNKEVEQSKGIDDQKLESIKSLGAQLQGALKEKEIQSQQIAVQQKQIGQLNQKIEEKETQIQRFESTNKNNEITIDSIKRALGFKDTTIKNLEKELERLVQKQILAENNTNRTALNKSLTVKPESEIKKNKIQSEEIERLQNKLTNVETLLETQRRITATLERDLKQQDEAFAESRAASAKLKKLHEIRVNELEKRIENLKIELETMKSPKK